MGNRALDATSAKPLTSLGGKTASDTNITRGEAEQIGGQFHFFPGTNIASIEISTFHVLHCVVRSTPNTVFSC